MSTYGLRVKDAAGTTIWTSIDEVARFRYSNEVTGGASGNTTLSDISGLSSIELGILIQTDCYLAAHDISRSGTTITWTARSGMWIDSGNSLIFLFLYT